VPENRHKRPKAGGKIPRQERLVKKSARLKKGRKFRARWLGTPWRENGAEVEKKTEKTRRLNKTMLWQ